VVSGEGRNKLERIFNKKPHEFEIMCGFWGGPKRIRKDFDKKPKELERILVSGEGRNELEMILKGNHMN
jgi:hypothetical protein